MSARFLFEGSWYSVEQCGRLLHSSTALYDAGHFSASAGLALLAIEELGKGRILLDLWRQQRSGTSFEIGQVKRALDNHERKLKAGQTLFRLDATPGSPGWDLLQIVTAKPDTPEGREAMLKIADLALKRGKRTPRDRHEARQRAFYVDPDPSGTTWQRPSQTTKDAAEQILLMAMNDYASQLALAESQRELADALTLWPERPPLPERVWPKPGP